MKQNMRLFTALMLTVMLATSSLTMALARGQAMAAGEMVLCTGSGPVSIAVDAQGTPTGAVMHCPDCLAADLMAVAPCDGVSALRSAALSVRFPIRESADVDLARAGHLARGPPKLA